MPKTCDNIKVDFFNCKTDIDSCFKPNTVREVKNLSQNFNQIA